MNEPISAPQADAYHLIIASFGDEDAAAAALAKLLEARRAGGLAIPATATVRKDDAGVLAIKETGDIGLKEGAVAGGLLGGLLGALGKRPVIGAALGALLGGLGAEKMDTGIPDARLAEIGASLPAGSSALVAIVADASLDLAREQLLATGAGVVAEPMALSLDTLRQLSQGRIGDALGSLATQTESFVASAAAKASELATDALAKTKDMAADVMGKPEPPIEPPSAGGVLDTPDGPA